MSNGNDTQATAADIAALALSATDATDKLNQLQDRLDAAAKSSKDFSGVIGEAAGGVASLTAASALFSSDAYKFVLGEMERLSRLPRFIASEIAGSNVIAGTQLSGQAEVLMRDMYDTQARIAKETVTFGVDASGKEITRNMALLYKDGEEQGRAFYESAVKDSTLYVAAINALGKEGAFEMKETANVVQRGLGITAETLRNIYTKEYAQTGEITGKFVENFGATVIAAEKITGLSSKALTEDMTRMMANLNTYGGMADSEMAALSARMHQLGVDFDNTDKAVNKFLSFEGAVEASAKIAGLTGAITDPQRLFMLAATDKPQFLLELKAALDPVADTIREMPSHVQALTAQTVGLEGATTLLKLLNADIGTTGEGLEDIIAQTAEAEEFKKGLETELRGRDKAGVSAAFDPDKILAATKAVMDLTGASEKLAGVLESFANKVGSIGPQIAPIFAEAGKTISEDSTEMLGQINQLLNGLKEGVEKFVAEGGLEKIIQLFERMLTGLEGAIEKSGLTPKSVPPVWQKVLDGMSLFRGGMSESFDETRALVATKMDGIANVESDKSRALFSGIKGSLDQINEMEGKISEAGELSITTTSMTPTRVATPTLPQSPVELMPAAAAALIPATTTAEAPSTTTTDMKVKIHLDLDTANLENLIEAKVTEVLKGNIVISTPSGKYGPSTYRVVLEEA
jgi:hypothetical protein